MLRIFIFRVTLMKNMKYWSCVDETKTIVMAWVTEVVGMLLNVILCVENCASHCVARHRRMSSISSPQTP